MFLPRAVDGDEVEPWVYLRAIEEVSRHDGSFGWNLFVCNSASLIAPFLEPETMHAIFDDPRTHRRLGSAERVQGDRGAGRLSDQRRMGLCQRLPAGQLDGRACARSSSRTDRCG